MIFRISGCDCGIKGVNGDWYRTGVHNDRAQHLLINDGMDDKVILQCSVTLGVRRIAETPGFQRSTYPVSSNAKEVPTTGWEVEDGPDPAPTFH